MIKTDVYVTSVLNSQIYVSGSHIFIYFCLYTSKNVRFTQSHRKYRTCILPVSLTDSTIRISKKSQQRQQQ